MMPLIQDFAQYLFLILIILQGVIFFIEQPLHFKRGLGDWERLSHPVDAFLLTICMITAYFADKLNSPVIFWLYCILAIIAIAMTFKDEHIHQRECPQFEQFIHAIMFTFNGIILVTGTFIILSHGKEWTLLIASILSAIAFVWIFAFNFFTPYPKRME